MEIQKINEAITGLGRLLAEIQDHDIEKLQNPYYTGILADAIAGLGELASQAIEDQLYQEVQS